MENQIYQKIAALQKSAKRAILVTVVRVRGSVPRAAGAKMLVFADGKTEGTIGGGAVEKIVIEEALQVLQSGKAQLIEHSLDDKQAADTGMVCGGRMEFFMEPIQPAGHLYIFGGGHIAFYLAKMVELLEWPYTVIDDRADFCNAERFPKASETVCQDPGNFARHLQLQANDMVVTLTRGHAHDYAIVRALLPKSFTYLGMIGSKRKRAEVFLKLKNEDGMQAADLERIHSPIGLDIAAETPQEIAVSILAELIQVRRQSSQQEKGKTA